MVKKQRRGESIEIKTKKKKKRNIRGWGKRRYFRAENKKSEKMGGWQTSSAAIKKNKDKDRVWVSRDSDVICSNISSNFLG